MIVLSLFRTHLETIEGNYNGKMGKQYFDDGFTVAFQCNTFLSNLFFRKQKLFMGLIIKNLNASKKVLRKKAELRKKLFLFHIHF
jgi:hypothetical protein